MVKQSLCSARANSPLPNQYEKRELVSSRFFMPAENTQLSLIDLTQVRSKNSNYLSRYSIRKQN